MKKPVIYQLVVRYFGNTNRTNKCAGTIEENGCGKFNDINDAAIQSLKDLGVTHVWLMGVLRHASLTGYSQYDPELKADVPDIVKGRAGSPYAVRDYVDVCPDFITNPDNLRTPEGRLSEFKALIDRLHAKGLKVIIDFVPNHVSRAYKSYRPDCNFGGNDDKTMEFKIDNNFLYLPGEKLVLRVPPHWKKCLHNVTLLGTYPPEDGLNSDHVPKCSGEIDNSFFGKHDYTVSSNHKRANPAEGSWYESIKLNYGIDWYAPKPNPVPSTWRIVDQIFQFWQEQGVDGFRCDMANYIPMAAWSYFIEQAHGRAAEVYFIAESYGDLPNLVNAGFDAAYNDQLYDVLSSIYQEAKTLDEKYHGQLTWPPIDMHYLLNYLENHDEARIPTPIDNNGMKKGFGSIKASYQLAPLQFLAYPGPVMLLNGQEIGQRGMEQVDPGFSSKGDGRTTFFDYWCMLDFADWVNGHAYDGGLLNPDQKRLRKYYGDLLGLCQDPAVCSGNYYGLRNYNNNSMLFSFGRYESMAGRLLLIVANFKYKASETDNIRLPADLTNNIGWPANDSLSAHLLLDQNGRPASVKKLLQKINRTELEQTGLPLTIPEQDCWVIEIVE